MNSASVIPICGTTKEATWLQNQIYPCIVCGKSFRNDSDLLAHSRVHTGVKPKDPLITCDICGKNFKTASYLSEHKRYHSGERPFPCDYCEKAFTNLSNLNVHKRNLHEVEKKFSCEECGRKFRNRYYLRLHERYHTGQSPFFCDQCGKCFSTVYILGRHNKKFHADLKSYFCNECGSAFYYKTELSYHESICTGGKPSSCTSYEKRFCGNSDLGKLKGNVHEVESRSCHDSSEHSNRDKDVSQRQGTAASKEIFLSNGLCSDVYECQTKLLQENESKIDINNEEINPNGSWRDLSVNLGQDSLGRLIKEEATDALEEPLVKMEEATGALGEPLVKKEPLTHW